MQPTTMKTKMARMSAGCAVVNGVIYLAGGHNMEVYLDPMARCDPRAPKWRMVRPPARHTLVAWAAVFGTAFQQVDMRP